MQVYGERAEPSDQTVSVVRGGRECRPEPEAQATQRRNIAAQIASAITQNTPTSVTADM
uniref:hypothetical protein n=1 Tax=Amycolatopsis sp. CA-096443 TaxID=3239919 RepID=UPI003F49B363